MRKIPYLNGAQAAVRKYGCRHTTIEAARATGKTSGMQSPFVVNVSHWVPESLNLFLGCSIKQLLQKTVPVLMNSIEDTTPLRRDIDFTYGKAPRKLGFKMPIISPQKWEQCIHFRNGTVWYCASTNVKASANGMSVCAIADDECRFQRPEVLFGEIFPTLRGHVSNNPLYNDETNPWYKSTFLTSDAPLTRSQGWMHKRKDQQTREINMQIAQMIRDGERYPWLREDKKFLDRLQRLRSQASIFFSFSTLENIELLGEGYVKDMKRQLTESMFNTSVLNLDKEDVAEGYYICFDPDVHCYDNDDDLQLHVASKRFMSRTTTIQRDGSRIDGESLNFQQLMKTDDCEMDVDILPQEPLRIGLDYNSKINCIVTGQTPSRANSQFLKVLSAMAYIKADRLEGLMKKWSRYYKPHQATCKDVIFYYDSTAKQGAAYASERFEDTQYYNIVKKVLKAEGWNVVEVSMGATMSHQKRFEIINNCFSGVMKPLIRINRDNCRYLVTSLENAGVLDGFRKDKTHEKDRVRKDVEDTDLEEELATRTDMSDAFDTLLIGVRNFGSGGIVGVGLPMM